MKRGHVVLGAVILAACSSTAVVIDGGTDAADDAKDEAATADAKVDGITVEASVDATVESGADATLGDAADATISDSGSDAPVESGFVDAGPCSDAAVDGAATTLATSQFTLFVAIDSANVYWGSGNAIRQCATGGCGGTPATLVTLPLGHGASAVAADGTNVYAAVTAGALDAGTSYVMSCASTGCDSGVTLAGGQMWPLQIAIDATNVYWTDYYANTVMACAKSGCGGVPTVIASAQNGPWSIATDGTNVYWTTIGAVDAGPSGVFYCPTSGCTGNPTPIVLAPYYDAGGPTSAVATDGVNVYWTFGTGAVSVVAQSPLDGGASTILANAEYDVRFLTTDGKHVYWTNHASFGKVRRCSVDGCCNNPTTLTTQDTAQAIVVDSTSLYWSLFGGSTYGVVQFTPK